MEPPEQDWGLDCDVNSAYPNTSVEPKDTRMKLRLGKAILPRRSALTGEFMHPGKCYIHQVYYPKTKKFYYTEEDAAQLVLTGEARIVDE